MNGRTILACLLAFSVVFVLPFSVDAEGYSESEYKFPEGEYKYPPKKTPKPTPTDDSGLKNVLGDTKDYENLRDYGTNTWPYIAGKKVAHLSMNGWACTGFLVGPDLLMTNDHCLFAGKNWNGPRHRLQDFKVYMDYYERFSKGFVSAGVKEILKRNKELDYALLRLDKPIGNAYGWLKLDARTNHLDKGSNVAIIQHPLGHEKKIVMINSSITEVYADVIHYQADSEGGSSGGPVFFPAGYTGSWRGGDDSAQFLVVAIHHAARSWVYPSGLKVPYANEGILMAKIVPEIKQWLPSVSYSTWDEAAKKVEAGKRDWRGGRFEDAIADFTEAIRLNPKEDGAYAWRGRAKMELKRYEAAIADFTEAIRLNPKDYRTYDWRGEAKLFLERLEDAIADFTEAIRLYPNDSGLYIVRGFANLALKRDKAAIADYTEAIRLNPKDAEPYMMRGFAKIELKRYEAAIADYTEAIRLNPKDAKPHAMRGFAKEKLKRFQGARTDYRTALNLAQKAGDKSLSNDIQKAIQNLPSR